MAKLTNEQLGKEYLKALQDLIAKYGAEALEKAMKEYYGEMKGADDKCPNEK